MLARLHLLWSVWIVQPAGTNPLSKRQTCAFKVFSWEPSTRPNSSNTVCRKKKGPRWRSPCGTAWECGQTKQIAATEQDGAATSRFSKTMNKDFVVSSSTTATVATTQDEDDCCSVKTDDTTLPASNARRVTVSAEDVGWCNHWLLIGLKCPSR